jgi:RNA polymerase sigma-70 factor (ECF subfamily)
MADFSEVGEGGRLLAETVSDPGADPERVVSAGELLDRVEAGLQQLPEHYQTVLWLRDGEDLSYQQISSVLDIPIGTVRSRLARARARLREMVD